MKLLASVKYQLVSSMKSAGVFYAVIYLIIALALLIGLNKFDEMSISGLETSTAVFMVFLGIFTFEEDFKFLIQNGYSRKTMLKSFLVEFACLSLLMSCVDIINTALLSNILPSYRSLFIQIYGEMNLLWNFAWCFTLYFMLSMVGYFFTVIFKRLNMIARYIIFGGIPFALFILVPTIDVNLMNGAISTALLKYLTIFMGVYNGIYFLYPVLTFSVMSLIFAIFVYLATRRATNF